MLCVYDTVIDRDRIKGDGAESATSEIVFPSIFMQQSYFSSDLPTGASVDECSFNRSIGLFNIQFHIFFVFDFLITRRESASIYPYKSMLISSLSETKLIQPLPCIIAILCLSNNEIRSSVNCISFFVIISFLYSLISKYLTNRISLFTSEGRKIN